MKQQRSALRILLYLVCFGIVYGSLFPFEFALAPDREVVDKFLRSWRAVSGPGDTLGNIALFMPFGLLAHMLWQLPGPGFRDTRYFVLLWLLVAAGSQLLQFFVPGRDPSVYDLYCNAGGTALGWALLHVIPEKTAAGLARVNLPQQIPVLLPLLWLAAELIPFVPTIDFQAYKSAIKPLLLYPQWYWYDAALQASCWIVCFYLLDRCAGIRLSLRHLLPGALVYILLKIVIVKNSVSVTDVVAIIVALAAWLGLRERNIRPRMLACILLLSVVTAGIFPFLPRPAATAFGWIPFSGFLQGSMLTNATALCQKLFVFGSLAFLTQQRDGGWIKCSLLIAMTLMLVEVLQVRVASGTPELTDPVLFLAVAWLYAQIRSQEGSLAIMPGTAAGEGRASVNAMQARQHAKGGPEPLIALENAAQLLQQSRRGEKSLVRPPGKQPAYGQVSRKRLGLVVGAYCVAVVILLRALLALPGVPYNIAELFRFDASGVDLLFFALTLLSIGWGGAWLGRVFADTTRPFKDIPLALIKLAFIIYGLLWMSVTRESIMDITGSSVFVHRVVERGVLGDFGVQVIALLGRSNVNAVTSVFEPVIRLGALIGPFLISCGLCFWILKPAGYSAGTEAASGKKYVTSGILIVLLLYVCKVLAFDWSSTDNLNELIAPDGVWGIGGGGYLYLLIFLFSAMAALVSWGYFRNVRTLLVALLIVMLSLPVSWFLLNHGLGKDIGKYGAHFSGVDFLLGPDRRNLISQSQLMLRWSVLHTIAVMGLAFSANLYFYWAGSRGISAPIFKRPKTAPGTATEFRVYEEQWEFLQNLAGSTGLSIDRLVLAIISYFGGQISVSPENRQVLQDYISRVGSNDAVSFSPTVIHMELSSEALAVVSSLDPGNAQSASRVFRKLLKIFMAVAREQADR